MKLNFQGTTSACVPECFHGMASSPASDMWSNGCIPWWFYPGGKIEAFGRFEAGRKMRVLNASLVLKIGGLDEVD